MVRVKWLVSLAKQYWQPRILGECRVRQGTLAHVEDRPPIGFDPAHEFTILAKAHVHRRVSALHL